MTWYPGKNIERVLGRRRRDSAEENVAQPTKGKEEYYLRFNKDEIFKNLIAIEGHFRNVANKEENIEAGFLNCAVKHAADAEGHAEEAISHATVVESEESARLFGELHDGIRTFRWKLQREGMNPFDGIKEVRRLRRMFESFNGEYDVSKCKACEPVEILMKKALEQQKECLPESQTST